MPLLPRFALCALLAACAGAGAVRAQDPNAVEHRRGRIWETLRNDGFIGDLGAWDFGTTHPLGLFPGFEGYVHPFGGEGNAVDVFANATFHNFRSGVWIGVRDLRAPGPPPGFLPVQEPYAVFASGGQFETFGAASANPPITLHTNYLEDGGYDPAMPEEWTEATWDTNTGITVTRRSYVWGFPGYDDVIVYDYTFTNTGRMVARTVGQVVPNVDQFQQTLRDVWFAFHSGISVSTKSQINFHADLVPVAAGGFGWQPPSYHDYYSLSTDRTLAFSYNVNGGIRPTTFDTFPKKDSTEWQSRFPGPELQSPAAFGWLALHADPAVGDPNPASPAPEVLRIDSHKGGTFNGNSLNLEQFSPLTQREEGLYRFITTPGLQPGLGNNGNRFNFYTFSYGPYTLAPGASVRIVLAEIAGVMDYSAINAGDPGRTFPDSTIAAIERNAVRARNAVRWGIGATSPEGFPLAADVPEPPPAPAVDAVNGSTGTTEAAIAVTWDRRAETTSINDGAGVFYDGLADLDGYRVYRSTDFQYVSDGEPPVLRGATWTLLADVPIAEAGSLFDPELGRYLYRDSAVAFGRRYGYYVAAYNSSPRTWTSANGTVVPGLPELVSGSTNRTAPVAAVAGPTASFDVYAVPNPYVHGDPVRSFGITGQLGTYTIEFRNLPERATVRIYSVAGDLVRTLAHGPDSRGNLSGTLAWDQKSDSGLLVAPGVYLFHVESATADVTGRLTGRLMIIR